MRSLSRQLCLYVVSLQTKPEEEAAETPFVLAVTVKDEHGNIDLGAIAESEHLIDICQYTFRLIHVPDQTQRSLVVHSRSRQINI